jgi:uncharacterized protein (TIGR02284 family)
MENNIEVMNDLIKVNNDRLKGYEKAAVETDNKDVDIRILFNDMAAESRNYAAQLEKHLVSIGHSPAEGSTIYGDIYRVWMDMKASFTGKDRKTILLHANLEKMQFKEPMIKHWKCLVFLKKSDKS